MQILSPPRLRCKFLSHLFLEPFLPLCVFLYFSRESLMREEDRRRESVVLLLFSHTSPFSRRLPWRVSSLMDPRIQAWTPPMHSVQCKERLPPCHCAAGRSSSAMCEGRALYMTGRRKGEHTWADVKTCPCVRNTARERELFPRVAMKRRKAKLLLARGGEMEAWRAILWEKEIFSPSPFHLA